MRVLSFSLDGRDQFIMRVQWRQYSIRQNKVNEGYYLTSC